MNHAPVNAPGQNALSGRSLTIARSAAVLITVGIGIASFVLSFTALADLATRAGIPEHLAWLWPLIVDGTILQATMAVVALAGHDGQAANRRYFWIVLSSSASVSVLGNGWHAILPSSAPLSPWLGASIAVVAPVSLLASTHGLSLLIRVSTPQDVSDFAVPGRRTEPVVPVVPDVPDVPDISDAPDAPAAPVAGDALQPWESVAEVIATRAPDGHPDIDTVAAVLHLSYERDLSPKAIARQLGIEAQPVHDIVSASEDLLRSGDVSVERVAV